MRASDDSHFDSRGPVGQYWLANGLDFTVCDGNGQRIGVVVHVVVDRRRQSAERLIVRRRGLVRRPRYVALNPHAVELVLPDSQVLLLAGTRAQQAGPIAESHAPSTARARGVAASASAAFAALVRGSLPIVLALDRRLAAAAEATRRLARRVVSASADLAARTAAATRREAPRLDAWLSARAHENRRVTLTEFRRLGAAAQRFARLLGDLVVLAGVGVAAAWRRAEAARAERRTTVSPEAQREAPGEAPAKAPPKLPDPHPPEWRRDADAPLARERRQARSGRRARR